MNAGFWRERIATDPALVAAFLGLLAIGVVMVSSSSIAIADQYTGRPLFYLARHLGAVGIGFLALVVVLSIPIAVWHRWSWLALLGAVALLFVVLLPGVGREVNGSTRWMDLGPLSLQPSEPARLLLVVYLASYAVRRNSALVSSSVGFVKPMLVIAIAAVLLLAEPDFGASVVLTATSLGMLFVAGGRLRDFVVTGFAAAVALATMALMSAERMERILTFLNPWADPLNNGFQLVQSLIAIGSGDWLGVGLGESVQKLFYLPEAHTDFVFAVLAEELGLAGATLVIGLFSLLIARSLWIGRRAFAAELPFHGMLATGIGIAMGIQAAVNIGVNIGILPTKGLTLPLVSYGRSSMVVTMCAVGLLMRIAMELAQREAKRSGPKPGRGRAVVRRTPQHGTVSA